MIPIDFLYTYHYQQDLNPDGRTIYRPLMMVRLSSGARFIRVLALLDTGADCSMFDAEVANALDISIGDPLGKVNITGIGGNVSGYTRSVELNFGPQTIPTKCKVIFMKNFKLGRAVGVIGRSEFSNLIFGINEDGREIYVTFR